MATTIHGDEELKRKLSRLANFDNIFPALVAGAEDIIGEGKIYPPAPPKNKTSGHSWYDRGQGTKYMRKDGSIHDYGNSEDLKNKWTFRTQKPLKIIIGNGASYAPYVKDPELQSAKMAEIGWKTTDEDIEKKEPKILSDIKREVDRILRG